MRASADDVASANGAKWGNAEFIEWYQKTIALDDVLVRYEVGANIASGAPWAETGGTSNIGAYAANAE
jgi:hypothetical protein